MQLSFHFRPSKNVSFGDGFVLAENEKYSFGRSLSWPIRQKKLHRDEKQELKLGNDRMDILHQIPVSDLWVHNCRTRIRISAGIHFIYCTMYIGFCYCSE